MVTCSPVVGCTGGDGAPPPACSPGCTGDSDGGWSGSSPTERGAVVGWPCWSKQGCL